MTIKLDKPYFANSIKNIAEMIEKQRDHLTELDSKIGDGDHGINLSIGFREVEKNLSEYMENTEDIEAFLKKVGMTLLGKVGGASGPLYGSFFMKMGKGLTDKNEINISEFGQMIENGVVSVETRGKAVVGQKTMVDALRPGVDYLKAASADDDSLEVFGKFIEIMQEGAEKTTDMVAKKGRAARLGERSVGHKDPGAESAWLIMNSFFSELKKLY
ncbi:dihydroxyacetone kinase subunit L [Tetragenococcus halophilus subsp. flandriensis]|uniref:dihydroxyacetone kinase subunit DhaL n=1 Tax=Tetragenococcus halophilus TaxID=51669 RepID=UPI0023E9E220|nr:dihydroxyacetone kinase subunit DhaL [Tetragenococcus halophilus]GMA09367.1 dihydroxyacetone kinase subunit L [Tetragenococcus halophilus subsp. flandriensis]